MQLQELLYDDDAVSPVIGVILMVAITVILAAVIASFVLGLGGETSVAPQTSFSFDYDGAEDNLTISHDGGDSVAASEMILRGDGMTEADTTSPSSVDNVRFNAIDERSSSGSPYDLWDNVTGDMSSGQSITVNVTSNYDISVVWDPQDSDDSSELASDSGPDA